MNSLEPFIGEVVNLSDLSDNDIVAVIDEDDNLLRYIVMQNVVDDVILLVRFNNSYDTWHIFYDEYVPNTLIRIGSVDNELL